MINVILLLAGGAWALAHQRDTVLLSSIQLSALCYAVVTAADYNLLVRGVPTTDYVGIQWPNEVLHVWIPIFLVLDWILGPAARGCRSPRCGSWCRIRSPGRPSR